MEIKSGIQIFNGIAIGNIKIYKKNHKLIERTGISDAKAEIRRYEAAKKVAINQLNTLYEKAVMAVGEANAKIFNVQAMMLEDENYNESVHNIIFSQKVNAEYAIDSTCQNLAAIFANMGDDYLKARAADVRNIADCIISALWESAETTEKNENPAIIVADDLSPSEIVQMDKSKLLAFVTKSGSPNSHTAILARTMGIPALVGVEIDEAWEGKTGVVDGYEGKFVIDPEMSVLEEFHKKKATDEKNKELLLQLKGKENVTKSGKKISLCANIGDVDDVASVIENDADGIGLFRSEFLFFESDTFPTEEEQFEVYKKVAEAMGDRKVIIRTLDIGADKQADYFDLGKEENPALGFRAIRICLTRPDIFKTQLRAIYRAGAYGNISILYPMIISLEEVRKIKEISKLVREELTSEGYMVGKVEEGILIETPAAALMSDELANEADFFSIGTNDLTQYTLAIDRQNAKLDSFYDAHHPAVLRFIKMITDNAHKAGIWAGICGELGADTTLTETFLGMGLDEISVSPECILTVRKAIRDIE